jgi:ribosomal protein S6--L-glutamate ligase
MFSFSDGRIPLEGDSVTFENGAYVALGNRLKGVPEVITLGVKPNFLDYTPEERDLIFGAKIVLYPTDNYAQFFMTLGKPIFPSLETCLYSDDKIKQTTLFNILGIPHPATKFYYHLHHGEVLKEWGFPFIAKKPRASAQGRGVFKIENREQLEGYLRVNSIAYIQEFIPHERDLRVILVNYEPILAYWRTRRPESFRTNVYQGGSISFDDIPEEGIALAKEAARKCRFNDAGLDLLLHNGKWYVLEANMKYGRRGLGMKGLDLKEAIGRKLLSGELFPDPRR